MEKRTIIAIILSVLVLIGFQYYQQRFVSPKQVQQTAPAKPQPEAPEASAPEPAAAAQTSPSAPEGASSAGDTAAKPQTITIVSDQYTAVVDNRGAVLTSWELKEYESKGRPFEMIAAGREKSYPGSMYFDDKEVTNWANTQAYEVAVEGGAANAQTLTAPASITLTLKRGDVTIRKEYRFHKENYLVDLKASFEKGGKELDGRFLLARDIGPEHEHFVSSTALQTVFYADGEVERESPPDETTAKRLGSNVSWAGLDMHYFTMIAIPSQPFPFFEIRKIPVKSTGLDGKEVERELLEVKTPISGSLQYEMYLGPKRQSDLQAVRGANITGVIDYGMFSIIVLPLLASLRWIYQFVGNYGYAIIILTFLLSLLLFPFRLKQMISMKKMQAVQPKVKAIQEKYRKYKKTDPKRAEMNQEIMALYREHNVNPLGGCLPLLLQMPLLFAFYSLLAYSIELRHAPFILWIHDLSSKDPYYVLPIVMGITAFVSQKMTPMTPGADPMQAKMMNIMPVIFTFMFLNLSAGLNLYFLCSNIFQVAFQKIAERWMGDGKSGDAAKSSKPSK